MNDLFQSLPMEQFLIELGRRKIYIEFLREYVVASSLIIFWIGCNIGSFLNVCIYRLPLGMSLFHPKSHCPKCGHKLSWYENIPIFAWIFLCGACKECGQRISPRYWIVESLTGFVFCGIYLKTVFLHLPLMNMLPLFLLACIVITAAFTDCDLRIIPDAVTLPGMALIPLLLLVRTWPSLHVFDWQAMLFSLGCMAGTAVFMAGFSLLGRLLFKKEAFGWGDVKYLTVVAGALGPLPLVLVLLFSSFTAMIYMPVYWCFRPKRKRRGFAFAPFMTVYTLIWCAAGEYIFRFIQLYFRHD